LTWGAGEGVGGRGKGLSKLIGFFGGFFRGEDIGNYQKSKWNDIAKL